MMLFLVVEWMLFYIYSYYAIFIHLLENYMLQSNKILHSINFLFKLLQTLISSYFHLIMKSIRIFFPSIHSCKMARIDLILKPFKMLFIIFLSSVVVILFHIQLSSQFFIFVFSSILLNKSMILFVIIVSNMLVLLISLILLSECLLRKIVFSSFLSLIFSN